ncbi:hypothetical protein ACFWM0_13290 [Streptomyces sp. NPDC058405]|uniref:hypothetical protein n=1 Tax=Streptomyces sp. NPDC058405 TaxID=3346482 RepID=UPI00365AFAFF
MRLRTALVAGALAVATVMGGAVSASADDGHHGKSGKARFSEKSSSVHYENLGGPNGITEYDSVKSKRKGCLRFMGF